MKKKPIRKKKDNPAILIVVFALSVIAGVLISSIYRTDNKTQPRKFTKSKEIQAILSEKNFRKQVEQYTRLIERVGPEQAQEEFQHSGVPYTGQMHLLNHTAGDVIWKKYGPKGITKCKDYFSSSCYHGFIINAIGDGRVENLIPVMQECKKVGRINYFQCSHAVGHGLLAYSGYADIMKGLSLCDQVKADIKDFAVDYCYNGVFMENIWGLHEGRPSPDRWVDSKDIRYPCNYKGLKEAHLPECWYNQAIYMLNKFYKGDHVKVAQVCDTVEGDRSKKMCFDGVFRSLHSTTENDVHKKIEKCMQMPENWKENCVVIQASASYQQGDRNLPYRICSESPIGKKACYKEIANSIYFYPSTLAEKKLWCGKIPAEYRIERCETNALSM